MRVSRNSSVIHIFFVLWGVSTAFVLQQPKACGGDSLAVGTASTTRLENIAGSVSELERDLTPAERSITSVVRNCGPSVAFVTSVAPAPTLSTSSSSSTQTKNRANALPEGMTLGSGSGFVVEPGYICTNFHVIERVYSVLDAAQQVEGVLDRLGNLLLPSEVANATKTCILDKVTPLAGALPEVHVRINSDTKYYQCRIVDVQPDLDLAVLKIMDDDDDVDETASISFGVSSDLLVGQTVVAIGNPFGLDKTVTTGVVSAVNRQFRAGTARTPANRPIRNCIQTDAAINPGNSGGPLLNLKGLVVGINTAIITTSGSNAGIGFAVPADQLRDLVDRIIEKDRSSYR